MSKEVLLVIEAIANEKGVDRGVIVEAVESALASATKKRYPEDVDVRVDVDRRSGEYSTFQRWHVVEDDAEVEHPAQVIRLSDAQERDPQLQVGDVVEEPMESVEQDRHFEADRLQVHQFRRGEHVADVEHARRFVADVRALALRLRGQRSPLVFRDHLGRVPGDPLVDVHTLYRGSGKIWLPLTGSRSGQEITERRADAHGDERDDDVRDGEQRRPPVDAPPRRQQERGRDHGDAEDAHQSSRNQPKKGLVDAYVLNIGDVDDADDHADGEQEGPPERAGVAGEEDGDFPRSTLDGHRDAEQEAPEEGFGEVTAVEAADDAPERTRRRAGLHGDAHRLPNLLASGVAQYEVFEFLQFVEEITHIGRLDPAVRGVRAVGVRIGLSRAHTRQSRPTIKAVGVGSVSPRSRPGAR